MQMMKGMYVNNEIKAITRQRNRHDRASAEGQAYASRKVPKGDNNKNKTKGRTKLNLRVVQRHRLLRIRTSDNARLRHAPQRADPPEREEHQREVEQPRLQRRPLLLRRAEAQRPAGRHTPRRAARVAHVVRGRGEANGRHLGRHERADGDRALRCRAAPLAFGCVVVLPCTACGGSRARRGRGARAGGRARGVRARILCGCVWRRGR